MYIKVEKRILETKRGVYMGVVIAEGLDNRTPNERIRQLLKGQVAEAAEEFKDREIKEDSRLQPYRAAMEELGIHPSKYPCSIEAILTRISKKGEFPGISPVVDLGNYISLKYKVPVGVHDMDSLKEDLWIRLSSEEDCRQEENHLDGDRLKPGEPVYVSGHSVRTRQKNSFSR